MRTRSSSRWRPRPLRAAPRPRDPAATSAKRWRVAFGVTLSLSASMAVAYCYPPYFNEWVTPAFVSAMTTLNATISIMDATIASLNYWDTQEVMSAVAVMTKQKALGANILSTVERNAAMQTANALGIIEATDRTTDARYRFGPEFGQGYNPCVILAERQTMQQTGDATLAERSSRVASEIDAGPGNYADPVDTQRKVLAAHQPFCTAAQAASGLCQQGAMPGADLSAATLFLPAMEGEQAYQAKVAFVNTLGGTPDAPPPAGSASQPATASYLSAKMRKDAVLSPAFTALKDVQMDWSGMNTAEGGANAPLGLQFQSAVQRYAGNTQEYQNWTQALTSQNEHGALIELLKVKSLDLAILQKQYRQQELIEAELAALTAAEIQHGGAAADTGAAAERARESQVGKDVH